MSALTISVVIPAYNAERTLARAVDSVLAQTLAANEILIVDDGSRDSTADVARKYGERVALIEKRNGGAASARNAALDVARGDLIAFLDADDYWEPEKLAQQAALFERDNALVLVAGRYFSEQPGQPRRACNAPAGVTPEQSVELRGERALEFAMHVWTGTVMIRRDALGDHRFVSGLEPAEDRDLWLRVVLRGAVEYLDAPLATAVLEPESLSRSSVDRDCGNMLKVIQRNRAAIPLLARKKWESHTNYRWAACSPDRSTAWKRLLVSFCQWPLPYRRRDVTMPLARPRVLLRLVRESLGFASGGQPAQTTS